MSGRQNKLMDVAFGRSDAEAGLPVSDVVELLGEIARGRDPNVARAVADMLKAASRGQKLEIDTKGLGISPRLIKRLAEAAGAP